VPSQLIHSLIHSNATVISMRWIAGLGIAVVGIGAAIAARKSSHRSRRAHLGGLGRTAVDPFEATGREPTPVYYKPPKKDEPSGCLLIGRKHENVSGSGEYRVCLTENQRQALFRGKIGKKLGCGVFACAYAAGPRKVVKFTRDRDDVAALLEAQSTGVVPKVYSAFKLKQTGEMTGRNEDKPWLTPQDPTVYALVLERLKTLSVPQRKALDERLYQAPNVIGGAMTTDDMCRGSGEYQICAETVMVVRKLRNAGIDWRDIHAGNIGIDRKGHVKALDLGLTSTELKQRIDVLEGRRPGRPIKRRLRLM
jgi:hypothetical protein